MADQPPSVHTSQSREHPGPSVQSPGGLKGRSRYAKLDEGSTADRATEGNEVRSAARPPRT
ncbi:hypothetical protein [Haladaptatus sp. NG-SE-30]